MSSKHKDIIWISIISLMIFLTNIFVYQTNPVYSILLAMGVFCVFILLRDIQLTLIIVMIALPLSASDFMQTSILPIPGFKPSNLIFLLFIVTYMLTAKKQIIIEKVDLLFFILYTAIFITSTLRSMLYIPNVHYYYWESDYTPVKYILSHFLLPYLMSSFFILVLVYIRTDKQIRLVINSIIISMFVFSIVIIYLYIFIVPNKSEFERVREYIGTIMGMHGNGLSSIYIIVYPLLLVFTLKEFTFFRILTLFLVVFSVSILYSRTAYFTILAATIAIMIIMKKIKFIPIIALLIVIILSVVPGSVLDRAMTGLNGGNIDDISAGRVVSIWTPILEELSDNKTDILVGFGHYGIIDTQSYKTGKILTVNHPHNIYLDMILESGIFALILFLLFYGKCIFNMMSIFRKSDNELLRNLSTGILFSLVIFLVKGLTGGSFIPDVSNAFIWVVLGLACVVTYRYKYPTMINTENENMITGG